MFASDALDDKISTQHQVTAQYEDSEARQTHPMLPESASTTGGVLSLPEDAIFASIAFVDAMEQSKARLASTTTMPVWFRHALQFTKQSQQPAVMLCRRVHHVQTEVVQEPTKQQDHHSQTTRQVSSRRMP